MKKILIAAAALCFGVTAFAQQALFGGAGVASPVINADGTVTFRYQDPKAVRVEVTGDFLPTQKMEVEFNGQKMSYDTPGVGVLKEGKNGVWEYTTPFKVAPEMYTYTFNVDGKSMIDPNNVFVNRDIASPVNEITDLYTAPAGAKEMTFTGGESTWSTDRRYFDLKFSDLTTTLVGYDALLAPGLYMLGGDEIGKAIAAKTKVGGQTPSEGWLTVNNRDGKYQITAQFGDQVYFWTGTLPFQADPAPLSLTVLQQAQANKDNKLVTMQLATEGISQEFDMTTYQNGSAVTMCLRCSVAN